MYATTNITKLKMEFIDCNDFGDAGIQQKQIRRLEYHPVDAADESHQQQQSMTIVKRKRDRRETPGLLG